LNEGDGGYIGIEEISLEVKLGQIHEWERE
jgi:hypothetical protein